MRPKFHRALVGWRDPQGTDPAEIIDSQIYSVVCVGQTNVLREIADEIDDGLHPVLSPTAEIACVTFLTAADAREIAEMTAS
jgi:hypothetical protein